MKFEIDCQTHSHYSPDAEKSPLAIFERARSLGLKGVIVTDHNTTSHFLNIKKVAKATGLMTCLALEITATYENSDIHILAYGNNMDAKILESMLKRIRESYNKRSKAMIQKLSKAGIAQIDFEKLLKKSKSACVTKPAIADAFAHIKKIDQKSALAFFERGGVAYVPYGTWIPTPEAVVKLICKAGGKAVFAHPGDFFGKRSSLPEEKREPAFLKLMDILLGAGLAGIEVWYPSHTKELENKFKKVAKENDLLTTGGSDWHGPKFTPNREVGQRGISVSQFKKLIS
ncbi:MAG: hypothetical protein JWP09_244 [Candidatus Taylorbacteria bacterium]|nr:hypothetical protein [Candidatus Taylorbacteria bacterium]